MDVRTEWFLAKLNPIEKVGDDVCGYLMRAGEEREEAEQRIKAARYGAIRVKGDGDITRIVAARILVTRILTADTFCFSAYDAMPLALVGVLLNRGNMDLSGRLTNTYSEEAQKWLADLFSDGSAYEKRYDDYGHFWDRKDNDFLELKADYRKGLIIQSNAGQLTAWYTESIIGGDEGRGDEVYKLLRC